MAIIPGTIMLELRCVQDYLSSWWMSSILG